ncbi:MAG TPA: cobalamin B12-binding domain-containing protein [Candidatus Krumholzibacteria bacterium]|nr:cobalamin B12-binding domain-containing protein [Candidatus Krumholzibacteria bacterium]
MKRPIKVLLAKPGLDGHDRGAKVIANALRDAGMEVVYTGLHQTPEMIVEAAVQEDADLVSVSILSGAHMTLIPGVRELMNAAGLGDVRLIAGGIIPDEDAKTLLAIPGVAGVFGPGISTRDVITFIEGLFPARDAGA